MPPTALVAPLGPNPAPLTELAWALVRQQGHTLTAVHVVLESQKAKRYFDTEICGPNAAWDQLRSVLGDAVPPKAALRVHAAALPTGDGLPPDGRSADLVAALQEPLWTAGEEAQTGAPRVVFALSGGRWRASTALVTTVFQLRARPEDRLVDVRLDTAVAEGGTGFFFPEQPHGLLRGVGKHRGVPFQARDIGVVLDPVHVPRLRPLMGGLAYSSFEAARAASTQAIAAAQAPQLEVHLALAQIVVDGVAFKLSLGHFAFFSVLAQAARDGDPWVRTKHEDRLRAMLAAWRTQYLGTGRGTAFTSNPVKVIRQVIAGEKIQHGDENLLSQRWPKLRSKLEELSASAAPSFQRVIPKRRGGFKNDDKGHNAWRLDLPPGHIRMVP